FTIQSLPEFPRQIHKACKRTAALYLKTEKFLLRTAEIFSRQFFQDIFFAFPEFLCQFFLRLFRPGLFFPRESVTRKLSQDFCRSGVIPAVHRLFYPVDKLKITFQSFLIKIRSVGQQTDPYCSPGKAFRLRQFFVSSLPQKIHPRRSEEHTSELQSRFDLVCRL